MATTGIDSWAVDLADVAAVYPFQGAEGLMVIIGVALWIIWHVWQIRFENKTFEEERQKLQDPQVLERAIKEQRLD